MAQTAQINFLTPEVAKPVFSEVMELRAKYSSLFGGDWVGPGFVIGFDAPVGSNKTKNYFRLGGETGFYYQGSTPLLDLSFTARPIYPIALPEGYGFLNVYVMLLGGPNMMFNSQLNWGYHVAVIPGVRYILDNHWGGFTELGYSLHTLILSGLPNRNISGGVFAVGATYEF